MKTKKIISQGITALLSLSLVVASAMLPASQASAAKKIKLNKTKLTLKVGATYTLKLKNNKAKIKWRSSKKKIATVSAKGKVKAKKSGTTVITATAKGKKYKCKVTVKKAGNKTTSNTPKPTNKTNTGTVNPPARTNVPPVAPPTPIPTPHNPDQSETPPDDTETPDQTEQPDNPTPTPIKDPIELDPLAQNITLESKLLSNHVLITVTNCNSTWVDEVTVNYDYYDNEMNNIATGHASLHSMQPDEVQYISIPISEKFTAIDDNASTVYPNVLEADENTEYMDLKEEIEVTPDELTTQNQSFSLNLTNHSRYDVGVSYAVLFYSDSSQTTLVDVFANTVELDAKGNTSEIISLPIDENADEPTVLSTNYKVLYTAHAAEVTDETTPYIKNITLTPQKNTYTLLVDVKNNNKEWLTSLSLEYQFYDAEDHFLTSATADLLSMKPGETQTIPINLDADTIKSIDFDCSFAEIMLDPADGDINYNSTTQVSATVVHNEEENDFEITIMSLSRYSTEGSYLIKFYSDTSKKNLIGAEQRPYTLLANSQFIDNISGPVVAGENNTFVYPVAWDIVVQSSHTL